MRPALVLLLLLLTPLARAATYLVPEDAELIQRSDDVVIATGVVSEPGDARTRYTLRIEEVLKGDRAAGQQLVLTELGGRRLTVPGAPRYLPGVRYLVFTDSDSNGDPITFGMSLGRFELQGLHAVRRVEGYDHNLEPYIDRQRDLEAFVHYIRSTVSRRFAEPQYFAGNVTSDAGPITRASYLLEGSFRWRGVPDAQFVLVGAPGDGYDAPAAAMRGVAEWNATESNVSYGIAGSGSATMGLQQPDGVDAILFNDPHGEIPDNVVASGGAWGGDDYTFDGEAFVEITEGDVVFNPFTAASSCFYTVMTHELGHTLGIRHANRSGSEGACTADCATDAVMRAEVTCGVEGHLRPWDKRAAAAVYGDGPVEQCERADLRSFTPSATVARGTPVVLTATVSGTAPVSVQWYEGPRGDESKPLAPGPTVTVTPLATTTYWLVVKNACGDDTSPAVTLSVVSTSKRRSVRR